VRAAALDCPFAIIGRVGGAGLRISVNDAPVVARDIYELETVWRTSLSQRLQAEAMAAAAE
jgi:hypothetical protein